MIGEWPVEARAQRRCFAGSAIPGVYAVSADVTGHALVTILLFQHDMSLGDGTYDITAPGGYVQQGGFILHSACLAGAGALSVVTDGHYRTYSVQCARAVLTVSIDTLVGAEQHTGPFLIRESGITRWQTPVTGIRAVDDDYGTYQSVDTIRGGYNAEARGPDATVLFGAGLGNGVVPCDDPDTSTQDPYITSIGGATPDEYGNVQLSAEGYFMIAPKANGLKLINYSVAKCDCQDYANVYEALRRVYNKGRSVGGALKSAAAKYDKARKTMREERDKRKKPDKSIQLLPSSEKVMNVIITYRNNSDKNKIDELPAKELSLAVSGLEGKLIPDSCCILESSDPHRQWQQIAADVMFKDPAAAVDALELNLEDHEIPVTGWLRVSFQVNFDEADATASIAGEAEDETFVGYNNTTAAVAAMAKLREKIV